MGPIGFKAHLAPFAPNHSVRPIEGVPKENSAISAASNNRLQGRISAKTIAGLGIHCEEHRQTGYPPAAPTHFRVPCQTQAQTSTPAPPPRVLSPLPPPT